MKPEQDNTFLNFLKLTAVAIDALQGEKGVKGEPGEIGEKGTTGEKGADSTVSGPKGEDGTQGPEGKQGLKGDTGPQGNEGLQGPIGPSGKDGKDGERGEDGESVTTESLITTTTPIIVRNVQKAVASKTYAVGDLEGMSKATTNQVPQKQEDGSWAPGTIVGGGGGDVEEAPEDGSKYARIDAAWAVVTDGADGADGDQGIQGIQGDTGPQGDQGVQGETGLTGAAGADAAVAPYAHLIPSTTQNMVGSNGTVHYVNWDGTQINLDTGFTHSTGTNPSRIQVDADGRYEIKANVSVIQGGTARTTYMTGLRVNGTTANLRGRQRNYSRGLGYGDTSTGLCTEIDLSDGDYIEMSVTIDDSDGTYTSNMVNAESEFIIRKVA